MAAPRFGAEPVVWQPEPAALELVTGNRGSGKSHAARVRVRGVRRLLVWDPQGDHQLGHGRCTVHQLERLVERGMLRVGTVRLSVRPTAWERDELVDEFDRVCRVAYRLGGLCLVVEEVGGVQRPGGSLPGSWDRLIREGRHRGVSLLVVGQRLSQVPVLARDQATRLVAFRQLGGEDAAVLRDKLGDELGDQVRQLRPRHYVEWTPDEGAHLRPPLAAS